MRRKLGLIVIVFLLGSSLLVMSIRPVIAQPRITNTPISVIIPEISPTVPGSDGGFVAASPSPTFTPTPELPRVVLESIVPPSDALVRDFPENGEVIGYLESNRQYQVIGQYFSWVQIQFAGSPTGRAWVYIQTVRLIGNLDEIPFIDPNAVSAVDSFEDNQTQTAIALFQTPGVAETATAEARVLTVPAGDNPDSTSQFPASYTPPAEIVLRPPTLDPNVELTPTPANVAVQTALNTVAERGLPPIVPILALGVFGILGLLISLIRR